MFSTMEHNTGLISSTPTLFKRSSYTRSFIFSEISSPRSAAFRAEEESLGTLLVSLAAIHSASFIISNLVVILASRRYRVSVVLPRSWGRSSYSELFKLERSFGLSKADSIISALLGLYTASKTVQQLTDPLFIKHFSHTTTSFIFIFPMLLPSGQLQKISESLATLLNINKPTVGTGPTFKSLWPLDALGFGHFSPQPWSLRFPTLVTLAPNPGHSGFPPWSLQPPTLVTPASYTGHSSLLVYL
ncbi:hypothetical protein E2C01_012157 [Portunus trituberculatus]|uniref:Uncharacterized protein n=1 Tax=Portunus trituberculatus TaxID=210409 RepID=A0A5B7DDS4_PORTR|nr:hypothetical protein [Portunus trituberculatus]